MLKEMVLGATLALGVAGCKKVPTEEVRATVTLEEVYFAMFEPGVPTCYYEDGSNRGSTDDPDEGDYSLSFQVRIEDANMFRHFKMGWGKMYALGTTPRPEDQERVRAYETEISYGGSTLQKNPLRFEVTDWQGNMTKHEFHLEDIIKDATPYVTRTKTSEYCPSKL